MNRLHGSFDRWTRYFKTLLPDRSTVMPYTSRMRFERQGKTG